MCSDKVGRKTSPGTPTPVGGPKPGKPTTVAPPAPVHKIARKEGGHIEKDQEWSIKAAENKTVFIKMAGTNSDGSGNGFAYKHLLSPTSKEGQTDTDKLKKRVWHRVDKGGVVEDNPDKGAKSEEDGAMSRRDKYGTALKLTTRRGNPKARESVANSAIMLGMHPLDSVLTEISQALLAKNMSKGDKEAKVEVTFSKPCVKTADATGNVTDAAATIVVRANCTDIAGEKSSYEITHLEEVAAPEGDTTGGGESTDSTS